jgi:hypothetical protein
MSISWANRLNVSWEKVGEISWKQEICKIIIKIQENRAMSQFLALRKFPKFSREFY